MLAGCRQSIVGCPAGTLTRGGGGGSPIRSTTRRIWARKCCQPISPWSPSSLSRYDHKVFEGRITRRPSQQPFLSLPSRTTATTVGVLQYQQRQERQRQRRRSSSSSSSSQNQEWYEQPTIKLSRLLSSSAETFEAVRTIPRIAREATSTGPFFHTMLDKSLSSRILDRVLAIPSSMTTDTKATTTSPLPKFNAASPLPKFNAASTQNLFLGNASFLNNHQNSSMLPFVPISATGRNVMGRRQEHLPQQRRCMSSNSDNSKEKETKAFSASNESSDANSPDSTSATTTTTGTSGDAQQSTAGTTAGGGGAHNPRLSSRVRTRVQSMVRNTNIDDFLTVFSIIVVFGLLAGAPFASREMKKSDRTIDDIGITDDPVDDFPQLARVEWLELGKSNQNVLEEVLKDVVRSKALQEAAQHFVVQVFQSKEVQTTLRRLVKQLWTDLVTDPETVTQVIQLLQICIQDEKVKKSVQQLVLELIQDPEVHQAVLALVQRITRAQEVQRATQSLIVHSAHRSLNDPELLEHSMEFATDVLGDDVVQQTAGEALRNTVGHAFRPAATVMITATGITLILFGLVALGFARSSDKEVRLLEQAALSLQTNTAFGLIRLVKWPFQKLYELVDAVVEKLLYTPWQGLQAAVQAVLYELPNKVGQTLVTWMVQGWHWICQGLELGWQSFLQCMGQQWKQGQDTVWKACQSAAQAILWFVQRQWSQTQRKSSQMWMRSEQGVLDFLLQVEETTVTWWQQLVAQVPFFSSSRQKR